MNALVKIVNKLKKVKGLDNFIYLDKEDKIFILNNEDTNNIGIKDCLRRMYILFMTHDSHFRKPRGKIVVKKGNNIFFPGVDFPEVDAKNVISCSPSLKIHKGLAKKYHLIVSDKDASLFVGFDL